VLREGQHLYEVTTSNSKPSEVVITPVGRGAFFLPNNITFVLEVFRTRLRVEKASWTLRKFFVVDHLTQNPGRGQLSITLSSAYKWMRELPTA
jgi:hypothetical protein